MIYALRPNDSYMIGTKAIIWANAGILLFGPLGTKFNEILFERF